MTVYHGATVVLKIQNLSAEGKIQKEYLGVLTGNGNEQTFYTKSFPITDSSGNTTNSESDVDVFTRPASNTETFTELPDDGTAFDIAGSAGEVTIEEAYNQASDAGKYVSISYYTVMEVARGQNATVEFTRDLQAVHTFGSDAPVELVPGAYEITGTIESLFVSRAILGKVLGESDFYRDLGSFAFYIYPNGNVSGQPYIKVGGTKFYGGSIKSTPTTILAENVKFKGTSLTLGTV